MAINTIQGICRLYRLVMIFFPFKEWSLLKQETRVGSTIRVRTHDGREISRDASKFKEVNLIAQKMQAD